MNKQTRHMETLWVEKSLKGSKKAFEKLVTQYTPMLFQLLYDITGNADDAHDLTQEAFLRAYEKMHMFNQKSKFSTWLYRIAYNIGIDFKRKHKRISETEFSIHENMGIVSQKSSDSPSFYTGESEAIESALKKLTEPQRMAVVLHYYHGMKMKEIGAILDCAESTVRVHLFRALRRMKSQLVHHAPNRANISM